MTWTRRWRIKHRWETSQKRRFLLKRVVSEETWGLFFPAELPGRPQDPAPEARELKGTVSNTACGFDNGLKSVWRRRLFLMISVFGFVFASAQTGHREAGGVLWETSGWTSAGPLHPPLSCQVQRAHTHTRLIANRISDRISEGFWVVFRFSPLLKYPDVQRWPSC